MNRRLILVQTQPVAGREHLLCPETTIGRQGCDLVLMDPEVSRQHALVFDTDDGLAIRDLGSTNGTHVNDRRLDALHLLRGGDVIRLGNTVFEVAEARDGEESALTTVAGRTIPGHPTA
jgi:two-component system, cell cycle response regulator